MTYPQSTEVSAGQPTASAHYNNLRKDALYLGMNPADSTSLGALLARFEHNLRLELLGVDRVRVPAAPEAPVSLVVNGHMLTATANVDLSLGHRPSGPAAQYYVFAVQTPGSASFSLDVNTTQAETGGQRRIGGFYWDSARIETASIYTENRQALLAALGLQGQQVFGGRLTLASGQPVTTEDIPSAGTVYYTPWSGNRVSVYGRGAGWQERSFTELSCSLAGAEANKPVDIFLLDESGELKLEHCGWSSATARAAALARQDGVLIKSGDPGRVFLGTVGITGTPGVTADESFRRLVWNMHNRVTRPFQQPLTNTSWTYTTAAWRGAVGSSNFQIRVTAGLREEAILINGALMMSSSSGSMGGVGIGAGTTNENHASLRVQHTEAGIGPAVASLVEPAPEGLTTYYLLEYGGSGITFYGSNGHDALRAGLTAIMRM